MLNGACWKFYDPRINHWMVSSNLVRCHITIMSYTIKISWLCLDIQWLHQWWHQFDIKSYLFWYSLLQPDHDSLDDRSKIAGLSISRQLIKFSLFLKWRADGVEKELHFYSSVPLYTRYVKDGSKIIFTLNINFLSNLVTVKILKITLNVTISYILFPFLTRKISELSLKINGSL